MYLFTSIAFSYMYFIYFSFNATSRVIANVMEGQSVRLTVERSQGLYGTVRVDWSCGNVARNDLTPWFGTLLFAEVCSTV